MTEGAHTALLDLEELGERQLDLVRAGYGELAKKARENLKHGEADTGSPDIKAPPDDD